MNKVVIYSTANCPYCVRAKQIFDQKGVVYEEIRIDLDSGQRDVMLQRSGGQRTVPQIFIGDHHVGGCDDLVELVLQGKLDDLLNP